MSTQPPACPVTSLTLSPPLRHQHPSFRSCTSPFLRERERARESLLLLSSASKRMKGGKGKGATKKEASLKIVDDREEFRKTYKQEHPNVKSVSVEKAPFEAKAAKKKSEYEKLISAYNKKQESVADDGDEESDRSKSEMNEDEENEEVSFCINILGGGRREEEEGCGWGKGQVDERYVGCKHRSCQSVAGTTTIVCVVKRPHAFVLLS
ncbi:HMG1/2-like protein [Nymphaea thermarum]|nr:HMG1/2-like protein [Nymphaea thermarum]